MAVLGAVAITRIPRPSPDAAPATSAREPAASDPIPEPPSAKDVAVPEQEAMPEVPGEAAGTLAAVEEIDTEHVEDDESVIVPPRMLPRRVQIAVAGGSLLLALVAVAWLLPREEAFPELETQPSVAAVADAPLPPAPQPVAAQTPAPVVEPEPSEDLETEPLELEPAPLTDEVDTATPHKRRRGKRRRRKRRPEVEEPDPLPAETTPPEPEPKPEPPSAAELLRRAKASYASGDTKSSFGLARRSYKAAPSHAALKLMALSACRSGKADAALTALRRLPLGKRAKIRRTCRKHGNPIPLT
jgi:hypothetical protein